MSLLSSKKTAQMDSVVLEIYPVFLYQIADKLKHRLKASEWDTSNPVWYGTLQIIEVPSNRHRRQVQFAHNNEIFGVTANKEPGASPMFQKARDSDRYFTTEIVKAISGKNEVFGIAFQNRTDGLRLLEGLSQYFTLKDAITTGKNPIKVEIDDGVPVPAKIKVEVDNSQAYPSDEAAFIQCHNSKTTNNVLEKYFEKRREHHKDDREKNSDCLDLNSTAGSDQRAQSSLMSQSSLLSSIISSTAEPEPPEPAPATAIGKYENGSVYFLQVNGKSQFVCHLCPTAKFLSLKLKELLNHWTTEHDLREPFTCSLCRHVQVK